MSSIDLGEGNKPITMEEFIRMSEELYEAVGNGSIPPPLILQGYRDLSPAMVRRIHRALTAEIIDRGQDDRDVSES